MSAAGAVIEAGPGTVRGLRVGAATPVAGDAELVSAALDGIDDEVVLLDGRPVAVTGIWRDVLQSLPGASSDTVALICPSWWTSSRITLVRRAVRQRGSDVVLWRRSRVLAHTVSKPTSLRSTIVVEITPRFVVVSIVAPVNSQDGVSSVAEPRSRTTELVADSVARAIVRLHCREAAPVLVDAPADVDGAAPLAALLAERVRAIDGRIAMSVADDDQVLRAGAAQLAGHLRRRQQATGGPAEGSQARFSQPVVAVLATLVLVAGVLGGLAMRRDDRPRAASEIPMTVLVEGRVALKIPTQWSPQRITAGPGSARVQAISPSDGAAAVHMTQSRVPMQETIERTAEILRRAVAEQPPGVFVDFNPSDRRAGRPAVTYREVRAGHHIRWSVLVDGSVRISIGCQSAPDREEAVDDACEQAVQSAHALA